ncbi:DUF461 domain-containing protein [Streptomyces radicis]|uniref:DUF461 domain-containing protein n=1 Tax=Streptomyces radicis TaxID=1750517 RepID=A0A3A9WAQ5_9ACTN|nr:DUF461 domain-containing protein [Streptomyces radicis]RKN09722.1 DUF461 domain-containing protein [Streptomyces radicis]RKN23360.1 DUF461 domain-containing protein [Streptomyces radicis]
MSSSLRRGVAAAFFAFSTAAALSACGAGNDAETGKTRPDNASAQVDDIKVQSINVVLPEGRESPGGVTGRVFNEGTSDQVLEAIALPDSDQRVELIPAEGESEVVVPARGSVALGGEGNVTALIADPAAGGIALGDAEQLVFVLSETGEIPLSARVVPDNGTFEHFEDWAPTAPPEPDPSETPGEPEGPEDGAIGETGETGDLENPETPETPETGEVEGGGATDDEGTVDGTTDGGVAEGTVDGTVG